jgi:hypothetical protein
METVTLSHKYQLVVPRGTRDRCDCAPACGSPFATKAA